MSSAGQAIGGIIGGVIGFYVGGPTGAMYGFQAGMAIGGYLDQPTRYGPRLDDLRQQLSVYGAPIPFEYGTNRHAGTVIWPEVLEAVEHAERESAKGGPEQVNYTYTMSFAILVCEGPIAGIRRIWANKKLVYDASLENEGATQDPAIGSMRIYLGTETQEVDPLIEATDGASPAYLGYAYVVFEDYDVTELNARLPQFEFEVVTDGDLGDLDAIPLGACGNEMAIDPTTGYIWSVDNTTNVSVDLYITDSSTGDLVHSFSLGAADGLSMAGSMGNDITFVPGVGGAYGQGTRGQLWVKNESGTQIIQIYPDTYDGTFTNNLVWPPGEEGIRITWSGLIHYSEAYNTVIIGTTNVNDRLFVLSATDPPVPVAKINLGGDVYGCNQILDIADGRIAALSFQRVSICTPAEGYSTADDIYENVDIDSDAFMASDVGRNRILVINNPGSVIYSLTLGVGYTEYEIDFPDDIPPTASMAFRRILYHEQNDKYYVTAHQAGLNWTLYTINPNTFEVEDARIYVGPTNIGNLLEVPGHPDFLIYTDSGTNTIYKLPLFNRVDPNQVTLSNIVSDICLRAGLAAGDIDVTQLTDLVDGYIVPRQMTARAAIEPLQQAYYFDAVESDDKIKFVKRGSSTSTTIAKDDRAAHVGDAELPAHLEIRRAYDTELPIQCDVEYPDVDADHQVGNQYDRRITKDTRHRLNLQLAIVMPAAKAKEIARCSLYQAWQKQTFRWTTTRKYAYLEPTDIVSLPTDSVTYRARITNRRDQPNGVIEWEGSIEDQATYSQSGADGVTPPYQIQSVYEASPTYLAVLDIPLMRDEDDNAGYYVAMGGKT